MNKTRDGVVESLLRGESVVSVTRGHSMEPLLREGKTKVLIHPIDRPPKSGDILLWWRWDDKLILHRLIDEDEERYYLRGDHCTKINRARKERVIGVVTDIFRDDRWISVTNRWYRLYVWVWTRTVPVRRSAAKMRQKGKCLRKRRDV